MSNPRWFYVFSYGSNLLHERIRERIPEVEVIQTYQLHSYQFMFNKLSRKDGSAKGNLIHTGQESSWVYGVIHRMPFYQKTTLDRYEDLGNGYDLHSFNLDLNGDLVDVHFYMCTENRFLTDQLPYRWYKEYVAYGMEENRFPEFYRNQILDHDHAIDQNKSRREDHDRVLCKYRSTL